MISTKTELLELLKRNGGRSVLDLAGALGLAPVTIRQHLTRLERDGLVVAEQRPGSNGRPANVYRLTAMGHGAFPRHSDRVIEALIREIGFLEGHELNGLTVRAKTVLVLRRLAERLADEYSPLLQGRPLQARVAFVTEVMQEDGGFAEWKQTKPGYEIRDYNCLFHRLLDGQGEVCEWHRGFLSRLLGTGVRAVPCPDGADHCCRFVVEEESAAPAIPAG